jgi:lipopolysaccharide export system protein LptA
MKIIPVMAALFLIATVAAAQLEDSMGGYTSMEIEAGNMKGNFATGAIEEMTGGVRIKLLSDEADMEDLPISANSMRFTWVEGRTTPTTIIMEKNVSVNHPDASVTADRAEWDFDSGELVFSGNPEVNNDRLKGLRGDKMTLNLKTNTFEVSQVRADQVPLQAPGGAGSTAPKDSLRASDIKDWKQLLDTIKQQAQADAASPGKQIVSQMSAQNQQLLLALDTALLLERKEDILKLINDLLPKPGLYNKTAWDGTHFLKRQPSCLPQNLWTQQDRRA